MAGKLQQIFGGGFITQHCGTAEAKGFAESDHQQFGPYALLPATAAPLLAVHADTVCVVNHQPGPRRTGQTVQLRQWRTVAVHAEYPFGHRQNLTVAGFGKQISQRLGLIMTKTTQLGR
ncbi:hypothetical protein D3C73_1148780 [compost metagenome]